VLLSSGFWRDGVALCAKRTPREYLDYLRVRHIPAIIAGTDRVDFREALAVLQRQYQVNVVRVDSGGTLNGVLLRQGLVSEVSILVYPSLVGGITPKSLFRAPDLQSGEGVIPLTLTHVERLESDTVWLRYTVGQQE
jgi:2,5-diamino-6-(ribosylamino)-4(3H)-pyrimidinone 5'-phosphate reductase